MEYLLLYIRGIIYTEGNTTRLFLCMSKLLQACIGLVQDARDVGSGRAADFLPLDVGDVQLVFYPCQVRFVVVGRSFVDVTDLTWILRASSRP